MGIYFKLGFKDLKNVQEVIDAFDDYLDENPRVHPSIKEDQVVEKTYTSIGENYYKFFGWDYDSEPCVIVSKKYYQDDEIKYDFVLNLKDKMQTTVIDYDLYNELQSMFWSALNDPYKREEGWEKEVCCRLCKTLHDKPEDCNFCKTDLEYLNAMVNSLCTLQIGLDDIIK